MGESLEDLEMYEVTESLEELRRVTRKTREYKTGVREAAFSFLDVLKRVEAEDITVEEAMQYTNNMFYNQVAPGQPKSFGKVTYR
jgi:predicted ATP-dependent protease